MMDAMIESCVKRKQQRDQSVGDVGKDRKESARDGARRRFRNGKTLYISAYKYREKSS